MTTFVLDRAWLGDEKFKELYGKDATRLSFGLSRSSLCRIYLRTCAQTAKAFGATKFVLTIPNDIDDHFKSQFLPDLVFEISYIKDVIKLDLDIIIEYLDTTDKGI
jgi:hypothetical protein